VSPSPSPEMGAYHAPESQVQSQAEVLKSSPEKFASNPEVTTNAGPAQSTPKATVLPQLPTLPQPKALPQQKSVTGTNPLVAGDEDLIEKEWVDKAKKIVADNKEDPYSQEKEVSKLQADYLKKRYGKEIKLSSE